MALINQDLHQKGNVTRIQALVVISRILPEPKNDSTMNFLIKIFQNISGQIKIYKKHISTKSYHHQKN